MIRERARRKGLSANRAVLDLLLERAGLGVKRQSNATHHDLDALAGSWTLAEARNFDQSLASQRGVDDELWR